MWIVALGLVLAGLHFLGIKLPVVAWVDSLGESASRAIRVGLTAGGIAAYMVSMPEMLRNDV